MSRYIESMEKAASENLDGRRWLNVYQGCAYTCLGRTAFLQLAKEAGATRRVGTRVIYDKEALDRALSEMR